MLQQQLEQNLHRTCGFISGHLRPGAVRRREERLRRLCQVGSSTAEFDSSASLRLQPTVLERVGPLLDFPCWQPSCSCFQQMFVRRFPVTSGIGDWNFFFRLLWLPPSNLCPQEPEAVLADPRTTDCPVGGMVVRGTDLKKVCLN